MKKQANNDTIIGIVGGVGPYAGLDLNKKIFDNTCANSDQEHLSVYLLSHSRNITDRTEHLQKPDTVENPAFAIYDIIKKLYNIGASIIGIPCNTAHSFKIFDKITQKINKDKIKVKLIHMIKETKLFILEKYPAIKSIGLLATQGTFQARVYEEEFKKTPRLDIQTPALPLQKQIHDSIYHKNFGIKAIPNPITKKAKDLLTDACLNHKKNGTQAIIMGCTEIPLALAGNDFGIPLIDPTDILAKALIKQVNKDLLKPE